MNLEPAVESIKILRERTDRGFACVAWQQRGHRGDFHGIAAELYSFEPTGAENLYVLRAGGIEVTTRSSTTETAGLGKEEGACLAMHFDPNWIYLFDPQDGRTIAQAAASLGSVKAAA